MNKLKPCALIIALLVAITPLSAEQIRAAFDVGSGQTKMTVAVVDEATGRPQKVLHEEEVVVLVGHDFKKSKTGMLSEAILAELRTVLERYRTIAVGLGAEELAGVATAAFRESKNGGDFIQKLKSEFGIDLKLISQAEEGRLGFLTAVAASGKQASRVIAWDSGGASFQISTEGKSGLDVYEGPWGASKVLAAVVEKVQGKDFTVVHTANPASLTDLKALHTLIQKSLKPASTTLQAQLKRLKGEVVAIGGPFCPFQMVNLAIGSQTFTKEQVWKAIEELAGKTDQELARFPEPEMFLPRLTLIHAVMEHFGISRVHYVKTVGSTMGILMTPHIWEGALMHK